MVTLVNAELRVSDRDKQLEELRADRDHWRQQATGLLEDKRSQRDDLLRSLLVGK
jgi:hypothetical protein